MDSPERRQAKRARATRHVVNSSPTIEASTSRSSPMRSATQDSQDTGLQDSPSSDPGSATLDPQTPSIPLEVPPEILAREVDVEESNNVALHRLHDRYATFLQTLCDKTSTAELRDFCTSVYPHLIKKGRTKALDESLENTNVDRFALAFVVFTWLFVCSRHFQGQNPTNGEYLHQRWASYFLSAFEILWSGGYLPMTHDTAEDDGSLELHRLTFAMMYWEQRFFEMAKVRSWASEPWLGLIEQMVPDGCYLRNEIAAEYVDTFRDKGVPGLRGLLLRQEREMPHSPLVSLPDTVEKYDELVRNLDLILASVDELLLGAIVHGQVARLAQDSRSSVSSLLKRMHKGPEEQPPSIYINAICDEEGISPTPYQWQAICDLMDLYIRHGDESDRLAAHVDQLIYPTENWPAPRTGRLRKLRRYAEYDSWTQNESDLVCTHRRRTIADFLRNMRFRLDGESEGGAEHAPLTAAVVEVGFSDRVHERLSQHRRHQSSNYIMNLAHALFEYKYPGMFRLHQHIIYHCWREVQPWYAEVLLTRLAQGYIDNAGGFSHHNAGLSNSSSFRKRSAKEWELFQKTMCDDKGFWRRLRKLDRHLERQKDLDSNDGGIERVKAMTALMVATRNVMLQESSARSLS